MFKYTDYSEVIAKYTDEVPIVFITISNKMTYPMIAETLESELNKLNPKAGLVMTTSRWIDQHVVRYCYENNIDVKLFDFYASHKLMYQFNRLPRKIYKFIGIKTRDTKFFNSIVKFYKHFTEVIICKI